ncbi:uncharacterized protein BJX67DRAFT_352924 [Aspergillus lucknowensis]|uniref:Uncharacterized protein n=1 Tax=Aspergillus lucknowensis TaxID=176173 RepID=A0ABR4LSB0_9EURO
MHLSTLVTLAFAAITAASPTPSCSPTSTPTPTPTSTPTPSPHPGDMCMLICFPEEPDCDPPSYPVQNGEDCWTCCYPAE